MADYRACVEKFQRMLELAVLSMEFVKEEERNLVRRDREPRAKRNIYIYICYTRVMGDKSTLDQSPTRLSLPAWTTGIGGHSVQ